MPCYGPWVPSGSSSKRPVACGQCIGCKLEYSRQWAVRIMHEAQMHDWNSFVTLTYAKAPESLEYSDFQLFMRRLRKARGYARFFCSGEYGDERGRPHFHAVLFGVRFEDGRCIGRSPAGFKLYDSPDLLSLWRLGHCSVGSVTFESAAYVARYVVKKITGEAAEEHYGGRRPEFAQMSRKPGIGSAWLDKFWTDVFPASRVVVNGVEANPPRFYRKRFRERFPMAARDLQFEQAEKVLGELDENAPKRLEAKEAVQRARLSMLKRKL